MLRNAVILVLASTAVLACQPPDCDRNDCGSCGNACCLVEFDIPSLSTVETKDAMLKALSNGGPDSRYKLSETAEGSLGFADLRPYKKPVDFIGQAIHTTQAMHYNDTVNWTLAPTAQNGTVVTGFSTSQIAGAYCDAGQNYKNIIQVVKALGVAFKETTVRGCPAPSALQSAVA